MKFLPSQLAYLTTDREARANLRALGGYLAFLGVLVGLYAVLFHLIKLHVEHEQHSWITGLYWTLVVMTTLGFGDITFTSDTGRIFSIVVLLSGVVFLLVMLPFLFIRLFYAPWLEARLRLRAPRELPEGTHGHVIIVEYDAIAAGLVERLAEEQIAYVVIEPDPNRAGQLFSDRLSVLAGESDNRATYERALVADARLVVANCEDTTNTNITLTVREVAPAVPVAAIVEEEDSVEVLELSGATAVLPLKHQLGEYLANRVDTGRREAHVVGDFKGLQIAEFPVRDTIFAGSTIRDTRLRQTTGLSVVGFWERGKLRPAYPDTAVQPDSLLVVAGTSEQIGALNALLPQGGEMSAPVLVVGAGKVGQAAVKALNRKGVRVHVIDRTETVLAPLAADVAGVFAGDAADRRVLERAGILEAQSVVLTTNEDAMNIYLAVYCRRLNARAQNCQPDHARAESRSHPPGRRRLRAQLHDARHRSGDVTAARLSARAARRRCGAVLDSCSRGAGGANAEGLGHWLGHRPQRRGAASRWKTDCPAHVRDATVAWRRAPDARQSRATPRIR